MFFADSTVRGVFPPPVPCLSAAALLRPKWLKGAPCYATFTKKKDKKQDEQVIFIQVAFFAVGAVLLLWYLAPWVLNRILNAGNVLGIAFAVVLLLCGMFAQPVTHLLAPGNHAPGAVVLKAAVALVCAVAVLTSGYMLTGLIQTGHRDETVLVLGCSVKGERPSRMLRQRIEAATEYLEKNPDSKAVLSGGQGPDEKISEAEVYAPGSWCAGGSPPIGCIWRIAPLLRRKMWLFRPKL